MPALPAPPPADDTEAVVGWVAQHLGNLALEGPGGVRAGGLPGGQVAADAALATLDITGYARSRSTVLPVRRRGATRMSPYVRHGLVTLPRLWAAVAPATARDRDRYRDELLWQEYARHLYARVGPRLAEPLRHQPPNLEPPNLEPPNLEPPKPEPPKPEPPDADGDPWRTEMVCVRTIAEQLTDEGWLVNQTRMWLASHWTVRHGWPWREGEDLMYRHLLDGSRAANRLGWQWTVGTGTGRPYGFSRWQVERRAPGLCGTCPLRDRCPIERWPDAAPGPPLAADAIADLAAGPTPAGPLEPEVDGVADSVWLTAESLGDDDPALAAHPELPALFVFDAPLLARLRLSGKRLVFLAQTLADLADRRPVEVLLGSVSDELAGRRVAASWTPVPGWQRRAAIVRPVERHPWPWLVRPGTAPLSSFTAWRRRVRR
ncbi:MAG: FAD-binding domain-containing protein [Angustibacter sp.]